VHIYVASSWRNKYQPAIVQALREFGHDVYDFRNPAPGDSGFSWSSIDPGWKDWSPSEYRLALRHPFAEAGYNRDMAALRACDACVLVLPAGRSASWELGFAMGAGKRCAVLMLEPCEPELMFREARICCSISELRAWAGGGDR
jgi:hypothetical protein